MQLRWVLEKFCNLGYESAKKTVEGLGKSCPQCGAEIAAAQGVVNQYEALQADNPRYHVLLWKIGFTGLRVDINGNCAAFSKLTEGRNEAKYQANLARYSAFAKSLFLICRQALSRREDSGDLSSSFTQKAFSSQSSFNEVKLGLTEAMDALTETIERLRS